MILDLNPDSILDWNLPVNLLRLKELVWIRLELELLLLRQQSQRNYQKLPRKEKRKSYKNMKGIKIQMRYKSIIHQALWQPNLTMMNMVIKKKKNAFLYYLLMLILEQAKQNELLFMKVTNLKS